MLVFPLPTQASFGRIIDHADSNPLRDTEGKPSTRREVYFTLLASGGIQFFLCTGFYFIKGHSKTKFDALQADNQGLCIGDLRNPAAEERKIVFLESNGGGGENA